VSRIENALKLRESVFDEPFYRMVYSEGDFLPGLIVDRYGDILVAQLNTAGMDVMAEDVLLALCKVVEPKGVLWRNDSNVRILEGLEKEVRVAGGEVPETVTVVENGALFEVPLLAGQKTGWFYDQRDNRARLKRYVKDKSLLDVCSYVGGWGITSLMMGAKSATAVDQSEIALQYAQKSAEKNGVEDRFHTIQADCFEALKVLKRKGKKFEVIVVDPPAFIKRRKDIKEGMLAYQRLNALAMELLVEGGILISCSCSFHMNFRDLQTAVSRSAAKLGRSIQLLERGRQSIDHPCHMNIPETEYLKAIYCRLA
jgi:23S rRNA (cytosine1962-C5)-methyltransferase